MTRAGLIAALVLSGCGAPPPAAEAPSWPEARQCLARALERSLLGREAPDDDVETLHRFDRARAADAGLARRAELLDAATRTDPDERRVALERLADAAPDARFERRVEHLLEQDDLWLAREIERDRRYSFAAAVANGALRMVASALQANPIGVVQPVVAGVHGVVSDDELDAGDRRLLALERRAARRGESGAPAMREVEERVRRLDELVFRQELWIVDSLLERRRPAGAAGHLHAARVRRPTSAEVDERTARLEEEARGTSERVARSLDAGPMEAEWLRGDAPFLPAYRAALSAAFLHGTGAALFADVAAIAGESGYDDAAERLGALPLRLDRPPSLDAVARAKSEQRDRFWEYVLTGARASDDPLLRYRAAAAALRDRAWSPIEPILWLPSALFRLVYASLADPIDDRPVVEALARRARTATGDERRDALAELVDRYERRRELEKCLAAARAGGADGARIEELAERVRDRDDVETRRSGRDDVDPAALPLPVVALAPFAVALGLDPVHVDGDRANGEIAAPGVEWTGDRISFRVEGNGDESTVTAAVDERTAPLWRLLFDEWLYRRIAARAVTYRSVHAGVPVELEAGIGSSGLGVYPRLLPEPYLLPDRRLYE